MSSRPDPNHGRSNSTTGCRGTTPAPKLAARAKDHHRPVFSVRELARRWGVDQKTILAAIELGQIPAFRVGRRRLLIPVAAIEKLEQGGVVQAEGE